MNNVQAIWRHKKTARHAFVTDNGVFVLRLTGKRTVERMKQLIEDGVCFIRSVDMNFSGGEWEVYGAKAVAAEVKPNAVNLPVKFSACRKYGQAYYFYKVAGRDVCYWISAHDYGNIALLTERIEKGIGKGSWKKYKKDFPDWEFVSLAKKP